jgi:hypothetical protein
MRSGGPFFLVLLALSLAPALQAEGMGASLYFQNRSVDELAALERGEVVTGTPKDRSKLGLAAPGAAADRLRSRIAALRPNYVTEFMAVAPADDRTLPRLMSALRDVEKYKSIIYTAKRGNVDFPLFDKMIVTSRMAAPGGEVLETAQHMMPFEDFTARNEYVLVGDELTFLSENTSPLRYFGFSAVRPGDMVWSIWARRSGDRCYFYGIGAMGAFDGFGAARERLEPSFVGRVGSFMTFMHKAMRGLQ